MCSGWPSVPIQERVQRLLGDLEPRRADEVRHQAVSRPCEARACANWFESRNQFSEIIDQIGFIRVERLWSGLPPLLLEGAGHLHAGAYS